MIPNGFTVPFASPEVLHPRTMALAGDILEERGLEVIGTAADMWSAGVACFLILTGRFPFVPEDTPGQYVPSCLKSAQHEQWTEWEGIRRAQLSWVGSLALSPFLPLPFCHPLHPSHIHMSQAMNITLLGLVVLNSCSYYRLAVSAKDSPPSLLPAPSHHLFATPHSTPSSPLLTIIALSVRHSWCTLTNVVCCLKLLSGMLWLTANSFLQMNSLK